MQAKGKKAEVTSIAPDLFLFHQAATICDVFSTIETILYRLRGCETPLQALEFRQG